MSQKDEMPFLEHLEELRRRLIICAASVGAGSLFGVWAVWRFNLPNLLLAPLNTVVSSLSTEGMEFSSLADGTDLYLLSLTEPFFFLL